MRARWHAASAKIQRLFGLLVLFCALRLIVGIVFLLVFNRGAVAWGWEVAIVVATMLGVYVPVTLAVRRWAPPHVSAD